MTVREQLRTGFVLLDGGMGTALQKAGLAPGSPPERWNLSRPEVIRDIHRRYVEAGADLILTNTFGLNRFRFAEEELPPLVCAAVENARSACGDRTLVGLDVGPLGRMLKPLGDTDLEDAVAAFRQVMELGEKAGADLIFIETMSDLAETRAAVLAAKEGTDLPVIASNAYGTDGRLLTGADPETVVAVLEGLGVDALGVNCSLGPDDLEEIVTAYLNFASVPVLVKPNAGLPRVENKETVYDVTPEDFCASMQKLIRRGVRLVGGCCGTDERYIAGLKQVLREEEEPLPLTDKGRTVIASPRRALSFGDDTVLIGERINPTGKKRLKQALREEDFAFVLGEALRQEEAGAQVLDVNVGIPEVDEKTLLPRLMEELVAVTDLPLQPDSANPDAMSAALRRYPGKALINSVNGSEASMAAIFPLMKKYGGVAVALTLDEAGIPATAEGRVAIARRILARAAEYGLTEKDLIFDPLTMAVSAAPDAARVTLESVRAITKDLHCHTSLGVSNVSFGLPSRSSINAAFFTLAMSAGLSAAIMNPLSGEMMQAWYTYRALAGRDAGFQGYLEAAQRYAVSVDASVPAAGSTEAGATLREAVEKGLRAKSAALCREALATRPPLEIIEQEIIPALDKVGHGFEEKRLYLPQLLMSAEAAAAAFEEIKAAPEMAARQDASGMRVVLATVKGDVHDIGKNIVHLLLENFGFAVTDLGKDVTPEEVVRAVRESGAVLVGLSALMTTTVPAMEETIAALRRKAPGVRVAVGGAVLTEEYARAIGADFYGKDAMTTVRYAERLRDEISNKG